MNKSFLFALISSIVLIGGCGGSKKQARSEHIHDSQSKEYELKTAQASIFDEDIEAFVLEEDDLFGSFGDQATVAHNDNDQDIPFSWETAQVNEQEAFDTIYFGYDSSRIPTNETTKMTDNSTKAETLASQGKMVVCKGKACKYRGTETYNLALSDQRAQSVARELKERGIPREHIKAFGVGTKESHAQGETKEAHTKDRCVDMYTLSI